jgi:NADH-quinone oxidoreductase subunit A
MYVCLAALWPLGVYFVGVILVVAGMLVGSYVLGQRHVDRTYTPYEAGILPSGFARFRIPINYYLIAMFFVIFDLEAVFIFAWAVAARELGWAGYIEVAIFIGVLLAALVYLWRQGALDQPTRRSDRIEYGKEKGRGHAA